MCRFGRLPPLRHSLIADEERSRDGESRRDNASIDLDSMGGTFGI